MKKYVLILFCLIWPNLVFAVNTGTQRPIENILNNVWNTDTNTLSVNVSGGAISPDAITASRITVTSVLSVDGSVSVSQDVHVIGLTRTGELSVDNLAAISGDTHIRGDLIVGQSGHSVSDAKLEVVDNGDSISLSGDGTNPYITWNDGEIYLRSTESNNADSHVHIGAQGSGHGNIWIEDGSGFGQYTRLNQDDDQFKITVGSGTARVYYNTDNRDTDWVFGSTNSARFGAIWEAGLGSLKLNALITGYPNYDMPRATLDVIGPAIIAGTLSVDNQVSMDTARIRIRATSPDVTSGTPALYVDSGTGRLRYYDGTVWQNVALE